MSEFAFAVFIVFAVIYNGIQGKKRSNELRVFARDHQLTYLDGVLPPHFRLNETSILRAHSIDNVIVGHKEDRYFLLFDCVLGSGKSREQLTVIAVRGVPSKPRLFGVGPNFTLEMAGEWLVACHRSERLSVAQIADHLSDV